MHFTVLYFSVWVTIYLNCDVISISERGPGIPIVLLLMDGSLFVMYTIHNKICVLLFLYFCSYITYIYMTKICETKCNTFTFITFKTFLYVSVYLFLIHFVYFHVWCWQVLITITFCHKYFEDAKNSFSFPVQDLVLIFFVPLICGPTYKCLTHWGWDKMPAISQETLSNAFSWMKLIEFRLKFYWITISQHWFR